MLNNTVVIIILFTFVFIICLLLTVFLKRKTNTISLSIPLWIMLMWLFKGGLDFSIAELVGVKLRYELELFPVKIDSDYIISYLLYVLYFISYCLVCFLYAISTKKVDKNITIDRRFNIKTFNLLFLSFIFTLVYFIYGLSMYREAAGSGLSIYHYSRFNGGSTKSLMTLSSWIALACSILGVGGTKNKIKYFYVLNIVFIFILSGILGNRHILLSGVLFYFVLYFDTKSLGIKNVIKYFSFGLLIVSLIMSIYTIREVKEGGFNDISYDKVQENTINMLSSSEFIYPHMSMYGVISNDVDVNFGHSFLFLSSALMPRFISDSREDDIYKYYIKNVSSNPFKGFTIANPTGWYLNFGVFGVLIGGLMLGGVCCFSHYYCYHKNNLFFILVFALFISDIIGFMRSGGPEPFRAVFVIKALIPAIIIIITNKINIKFKVF